MEAVSGLMEAVQLGLLLLANVRGLLYLSVFFSLQILISFWITTAAFDFFFFCLKQECDQVHIEDVASDDNGQDLRWCTEECMKCRTDAVWFILWGFRRGPNCDGVKEWRSALCRS